MPQQKRTHSQALSERVTLAVPQQKRTHSQALSERAEMYRPVKVSERSNGITGYSCGQEVCVWSQKANLTLCFVRYMYMYTICKCVGDLGYTHISHIIILLP